MAPVVEVLPDLEHLNLGYNALTGTLSCRLLLADRQLAELDLADNQVTTPWISALSLLDFTVHIYVAFSLARPAQQAHMQEVKRHFYLYKQTLSSMHTDLLCLCSRDQPSTRIALAS